MNFDLEESVLIYSPAMAFFGYLLIFSIFLSGTFIHVFLAAIPLIGAIVFLRYLREKNDFWWIGIPYLLLLLVVLIMEFIYAVLPGHLYEFHILSPAFKIVFYLLIPLVSLFLFAAMTQEFRKILRVPVIAVSLISVLILMIPLYDIIINFFLPQYGADYALSDVTPGFIIMIFVGFLGIPALILSGIYSGFKLSKLIKADIQGDKT